MSKNKKKPIRNIKLPNPLVATVGCSQETVRETSDTNVYGVSSWCKDYHTRTAYPCTSLQRFVIAHYQLSQGIKWNDVCPSKYQEYESFASSALHFLMVGHCFDLDVADAVANYIYRQGVEGDASMFDFKELNTKPIDYKELTVTMSAAAQQVFYAEKTFRQGYSRKSRYKPEILTFLLRDLVVMLMASIPSMERSEAIEQASSIMTKRL